MRFGWKMVLGIAVVNGVLLGVDMVVYCRYLSSRPPGDQPVVQDRTSSPGPGCSPSPALGTTSVLGYPQQLAREPLGTYAVKSALATPVVALLGNEELSEFYQVIVVAPLGQTVVRAPAGHYGLGILTGSNWCNLDKGFVEHGTRHSITGGVTITAAQEGQSVLSPGPTPADFHIRYGPLSAPPVVPTLAVQHTSSGFIVDGDVNGFFVPFIVDTGASQPSLPAPLAARAGVSCTRQTVFITAAGTIQGCVGRVRQLRVGPFVLHDVEVGVMPAGEHALLGMTVLAQFSLVFEGDTVLMTPLPRAAAGTGGAVAVDGVAVLAPVVPWGEACALQQSAGDMLRMAPGWWRLPLLLVPALTFVLVGAFYRVIAGRTSRRPHGVGHSVYYNPKEFRAQVVSTAVPAPAIEPLKALLQACRGDTVLMRRLIEFEISSSWGIDEEEAARRALARLQRAGK